MQSARLAAQVMWARVFESIRLPRQAASLESLPGSPPGAGMTTTSRIILRASSSSFPRIDYQEISVYRSAFSLLIALLAFGTSVQAQDTYPSRPIRLLLPF